MKLPANNLTTTTGRLYEYTDVLFATDGTGYWPLTDCCEATGKGSADSETGVVCRSCYIEYPTEFGTYFTLDQYNAHQRDDEEVS